MCDMLVLWKALNGSHRCTEQCTRGVDKRRRRLAAEEKREVIVRDFSAYGRSLEMLTYFKYLGWVILATYDNCTAVVRNLDRAKMVWRRMSHILRREETTPRVSIFFFKAAIQAVLIFGAETWVVTPRMGKALGGFQTQVTRRLAGQLLQRTTVDTWEYTSAAAAREAAGLLMMEEYIRRRQNTVAQYIATRSLLDLREGL